MASTAFSSSSSNTLTTQPNGAGEKLILRSTSAADTGTASVTGLVAAVSTTGTKTLTGQAEVETTQTFTTLSKLGLSAAQAGTVSLYGQGTKATGDLRIDTNPADGDTILIGLTGLVQTYTFKNTLTGAANEVKIGAAASNTADNLKRAINNDGTAGTHYGTGTAANTYVSATVSTTVVSLTDRIAVARQLAWAISQGTGATIAIRTMVGGVTGTLLAQATAGVTAVFNSVTLASEDLLTLSLPALLTFVSNSVAIGGKTSTLRFKIADIASAVQVRYDTSTDGTNWANGLTSITNLDDYPVDTPQIVIPAEGNIEYIRFIVATNANTADVALDARVIY